MCGKMQASGLTEIIPFMCFSVIWGWYPASRLYYILSSHRGFPGGSDGKEPVCKVGHLASKSGRETTPEVDRAGALISDFQNREKSTSGVFGMMCHSVVFCTAASVDQVKVKSVTQLGLTFLDPRLLSCV